MPADKVAHYHRIDIGIFLQLCLMENDICFQREVIADNADAETKEVRTAKYTLS
ncbi:MAG: hypothetical protein IJ333_03545 [Clostridia bacterium]|nr:hypothetical protein [Clostridia bacterium]